MLSEDERPIDEGDDDEEGGDDEEDMYQLDLPSAELCADYWQIHKMVKVRMVGRDKLHRVI